MSETTLKFPCVHILPQTLWHSPACIIGNLEGLEAIRDLIESALANEHATAAVFADDGEGYRITVVHRHDMSDVPFGYTDEIASGRRDCPEWLMRALLHD